MICLLMVQHCISTEHNTHMMFSMWRAESETSIIILFPDSVASWTTTAGTEDGATRNLRGQGKLTTDHNLSGR